MLVSRLQRSLARLTASVIRYRSKDCDRRPRARHQAAKLARRLAITSRDRSAVEASEVIGYVAAVRRLGLRLLVAGKDAPGQEPL